MPDVADPAEVDDPAPAPTVLPPAPPPELMPLGVPPAVLPLVVDPPAVPLIPELPALPLPIVELPAVPPGCMAGDPDVGEPAPVAVGRSDEGADVPCANAAVASAVAMRQAAICVFSIVVSL
jgi:hypothetical protein